MAHRRKWDKAEFEEKARVRLSAQPEPYKIWASQKSHRPKFLDQNLEVKAKLGGPRQKTQSDRMAEMQKAEDEQAKKMKSDRKNQHANQVANIRGTDEPTDTHQPVSKRIASKARGYNFDFEGNVGKTAMTTANKRGNGLHAGYYCSVCDCTLADSNSWLGHLNGRRHQKNLGLSVFKHTRSTVDDVQAAIEEARASKSQAKEEYNFDTKVKEA